MKKLKICDVKNVLEAKSIGEMQIPFAGFHLVSENDWKRKNSIKLSIKLLKAEFPQTKSVIVTKEDKIEALQKIVNEFEPDYIQLHLKESMSLIREIKSIYGKTVGGIQVIDTTAKEEDVATEADLYIIDKSYVGGTGSEHDIEQLKKVLNILPLERTFVAGGININNIDSYSELNVAGFDVQSGVKGDDKQIDIRKLNELGTKLGYKSKLHYPSRVGLVAWDINSKISPSLSDTISIGIDMLHIDVSDGFVGKKTDLGELQKFLRDINKFNSHLKIEFHLFTENELFVDTIRELSNNELPKQTRYFYIHINRNNSDKISTRVFGEYDCYPAFDVRDVVDENFEWDKYLKDSVLLVLPSIDEETRLLDLDTAIKLIQYQTTTQTQITIDRGVDSSTVSGLVNKDNISVVCGSYLGTNIGSKFNLLKSLLYE